MLCIEVAEENIEVQEETVSTEFKYLFFQMSKRDMKMKWTGSNVLTGLGL